MSIETAQNEESPRPEIKFENGLLKIKMDLQRAVMISMLGEIFETADHDEKNKIGNIWIDEFSNEFRKLFVRSVQQDPDFASKLKESKEFFETIVAEYERVLRS